MKVKTIKQDKPKAPGIVTDSRLDELFNGKVLFPQKLARANAFLAKHPFPEHLKK